MFQCYPQIVHSVFQRPIDFKDLANRQKAQEVFGFSSLIFPRLVHGTEILRVTAESNANDLIADGVFTTEKGIGLAVTHADCQAALFYDPEHEAIGVVHAGWRGQVQNIYRKFCEKLTLEVGTDLSQLRVCISPSLGPQHAEFRNYQTEFPPSLWKFQIRPFYFDLWEMAHHQLRDCGILDQHIEISRICTFHEEAQYFSYRRNQTPCRHATMIGLKEVALY